MKVSVVIPAYNEEKHIADTLKHVFAQTRPADEVIVVDNNSTDKTAEIAHNMGAKVIHETKQGQAHARNTGFNSAKGDILARTDADSIVPPTWLADIEKAFSETKDLVGLSGPIVYYDLNYTHAHIALLSNLFNNACKIIYGNNIMIGPNSSLRKSAWEKIKHDVWSDDSLIHEDIDISIHLSKVGEVRFDTHLVVKTSGRRIKNNPSSFFFGYSKKNLPMIKAYKIDPILTKIGARLESDHQT